jgi:SagB-type dehydrogenase family enzyme
MGKRQQIVTAVFLLILLILTGSTIMTYFNPSTSPVQKTDAAIDLPPPRLEGTMSVEQALHERRSLRDYRDAPLSLDELSQLLWAAQGVTHPAGWRTAASAGALYPLELLAIVDQVDGLEAGVYRYSPEHHSLTLIRTGDQRAALSAAALGQESVAQGAVVLALAGVYERTSSRYGQRGQQYVHIEVGIASQNIHLQAVSLGLGTVFIGAFDDDRVQTILGLAADEQPLCLMPIGRP